MEPGEWAEILDHLRMRVREVGLGDLDELIALDFRASSDASGDVLRYLGALISALNERSQLGYHRALSTFRESVATESGQPIAGIEVAVLEHDLRLFGTERINLGDIRGHTELVTALTSIRDTLRNQASAGIASE